jgi:hypothetical protein
MSSHLTFKQQKSMAELITAVVYQFVGWLIALVAVVLGASKDWLIWVPAGSMLLGIMLVRASIALSGFKNED